MNIEWTEADRTFASEVRSFLQENLTDSLRRSGSRMTSVYADPESSLEWQRILHKKGWVAPAWPKEFGGTGWSVIQRYIWQKERVRAGAPPVSPMGVQMCGPAIIGHGNSEQQQYFLPRMLSGEHFWCQGYSEPSAGSDLASLSCEACIEGDELVVTGQKVWSTHANFANWGFFLVRTSVEEKPQKGITFLLIDMTSPGISVVPTVSPTGENIQNEIFLDSVRVPVANVVGTIGEGWTVAKYLLDFERGGVAYAPGILADIEEIERFVADTANGAGAVLGQDRAFRTALSQLRVDAMALEMFEFRVLGGQQDGPTGSTAPSLMKIRGTELQQRVTELALEVSGIFALAYQPGAGVPAGSLSFPHDTKRQHGSTFAALSPLRYINERAASIYAGSNEIQRNIVAKLLGI